MYFSVYCVQDVCKTWRDVRSLGSNSVENNFKTLWYWIHFLCFYIGISVLREYVKKKKKKQLNWVNFEDVTWSSRHGSVEMNLTSHCENAGLIPGLCSVG